MNKKPFQMFDVATCKRCGIERTSGGNTSDLCRDCSSVLTKEEKRAWRA